MKLLRIFKSGSIYVVLNAIIPTVGRCSRVGLCMLLEEGTNIITDNNLDEKRLNEVLKHFINTRAIGLVWIGKLTKDILTNSITLEEFKVEDLEDWGTMVSDSSSLKEVLNLELLEEKETLVAKINILDTQIIKDYKAIKCDVSNEFDIRNYMSLNQFAAKKGKTRASISQRYLRGRIKRAVTFGEGGHVLIHKDENI
ncbi:MAG: hypothetical protein Q4B52_05430 [Tissierellia bacterium]|nr:hypothetical protein [Tissierellia bacterium]